MIYESIKEQGDHFLYSLQNNIDENKYNEYKNAIDTIIDKLQNNRYLSDEEVNLMLTKPIFKGSNVFFSIYRDNTIDLTNIGVFNEILRNNEKDAEIFNYIKNSLYSHNENGTTVFNDIINILFDDSIVVKSEDFGSIKVYFEKLLSLLTPEERGQFLHDLFNSDEENIPFISNTIFPIVVKSGQIYLDEDSIDNIEAELGSFPYCQKNKNVIKTIKQQSQEYEELKKSTQEEEDKNEEKIKDKKEENEEKDEEKVEEKKEENEEKDKIKSNSEEKPSLIAKIKFGGICPKDKQLVKIIFPNPPRLTLDKNNKLVFTRVFKEGTNWKYIMVERKEPKKPLDPISPKSDDTNTEVEPTVPTILKPNNKNNKTRIYMGDTCYARIIQNNGKSYYKKLNTPEPIGEQKKTFHPVKTNLSKMSPRNTMHEDLNGANKEFKGLLSIGSPKSVY